MDRKQAPPGHHRPLIVAAALIVALGLTGAMLSLLSPAPLAPDVAARLFVAERSPSTWQAGEVGAILQTRPPIRQDRWQQIQIYASGSSSGNAGTQAELGRQRGISGPPDHFIIGNGRGAGDGEVQVTSRWARQQSAASLQENAIPPDCIRICVISELRAGSMTDQQRTRLEQLVRVLQQELGIQRDRILVDSEAAVVLGHQ